MKQNKITDAINYLDMDLIMEADIPAPKRTVSLSAKMRITLAAACALLSCMLLLAVPFLKVDYEDIALPLLPPTSDTLTDDGTPTGKPVTTDPFVTPSPSDPSITATPDVTDTDIPPNILPDPMENIMGHLTLDVNPSLDITVEKGLIKDIIGVNPEGEELIKELDLVDLPLEIALPIIIDGYISMGYISKLNTSVILISAYDSRNPDGCKELLALAERITTDTVSKKQLTAYIISQKIKYDINTERFAEAYGLSIGKMQYILNLLEKSNNVSFESVAKASEIPLSQLLGLDINNRYHDFIYITDGYNEFGEKLLIVKNDEGNSICIRWDQLSREEQKEIYKYYKPSFPVDTAIPN
ncbi:MAG: hypothetical protein E7675_02450 [Ruminococcaceae bacterium]|nr:hypothetical protein [Oscillospiraceae bacterium]